MTLYIEYVQPGLELDDDRHQVCEIVRMTIDDAIRLSKHIAKKHNYVFKTDMDALYEAMTVNWATLVEEIKSNDGDTVEYRRILDIQENLREEINRGRR